MNYHLFHMMTSIYDLTRKGVFYNREYLRTLDGTGKRLLQQHRDIADAVLDGDADAAETAAYAHLSFVEQSFRAGEQLARNELISRKRAGFSSAEAVIG